MPSLIRITACLPLFLINPALAVDLTMSPQGYIGLSITPSAHLLGWGDLALAYDRQLPGASDPSGHNFLVGFGLLPHLEMSGRIAANTIHCNGYTRRDCGIRDLSANFKAGLGLGNDSNFGLAVGATDLGGAATQFRTYYGVATYDPGHYQISMGYAVRPAASTSSGRSPLDGPFASVAVQPMQWLQGHLEYSDKNTFAGARLIAPSEWLPKGWSAYLGINARLTSDTLTRRVWWNIGVTVPLYELPSLPPKKMPHPASAGVASVPTGAPNRETLPERRVIVPAGAAASEGRAEPVERPQPPPPVPPPRGSSGVAASMPPQPAATPASRPRAAPPDSHLKALAASLKARGLEDISVGRAPDGAIAVAVNNATYNWNALDAVGVALGAIAQDLAVPDARYRLIVMQRQTPIVALGGETACLKQWIDRVDVNCTAAELFTPGMAALERLHDGVVWVVRKAAPSWHTLRIGLQPVLNSGVATEYGVFDYSVGLRLTVMQPLWSGASAEMRYLAPLDNSRDFERGGVFGPRRLMEGVDRAILTQTLRLPVELLIPTDKRSLYSGWGASAVTGQVSVGKVSKAYRGVYGELRWEPGEGRHRVTVESGRFTHRDKTSGPVYGPAPLEPRTAKPLLTSYRYHHLPTETFVEVTGGRFVNHDRGWQVALRQWFSDTAVALYYKRTRFEQQPQSAAFAGLEVSFPLGPRKDMSPGSLVQIRGTPRWSYGVETLTGRNNNNITTGHAVRPGLSALNFTFNSDRAGVAYFENNLERIRDAAR
jgi:hypothetical protein